MRGGGWSIPQHPTKSYLSMHRLQKNHNSYRSHIELNSFGWLPPKPSMPASQPTNQPTNPPNKHPTCMPLTNHNHNGSQRWACAAAALAALAATILAATLAAALVAPATLATLAAIPVAALAALAALSRRRSTALNQSKRRSIGRSTRQLLCVRNCNTRHPGPEGARVRKVICEKNSEHHLAGLHRIEIILPDAPIILELEPAGDARLLLLLAAAGSGPAAGPAGRRGDYEQIRASKHRIHHRTSSPKLAASCRCCRGCCCCRPRPEPPSPSPLAEQLLALHAAPH